MLYKDDVKRYVLYFFKKGLEFGLTENEIIKNLPQIPGSEEDKQNLYNDCKAYLFLDSAFINHPSIAIILAEKYINSHKRDINLVDEKLFTMYVKTNQLDLANQLLEKLLQKDPSDKWTISKKINMLRAQRKYPEALQYIYDNYEIVKYDPLIFDLQYKLLYKTTKGEPEALIKLFKRIPYLNLGFDIEKRNSTIKKLQNYLGKTYPLQEKIKNPSDAIYIRKKIKEKIKLESEKTTLLANKKPNNITSFTTKKKNEDIQIVQQINATIKKDRNNNEKFITLLNMLENDLIKFFMECQISHLQGKKSKDLAEKVKNYSKKNPSLDETSRKSLRVLINLLTGNLKNIYLHDQWLRFQNQYFEKILNPDKQEKVNNDNKNKSSRPTL